jgi:hypothetical protein
MKIALIKEISEKNQHHLKILPSHNEEDPSIQNHGLVPNFAARWRAIKKYFISSDNKQPKKMKQNQQEYEKTNAHLN